METEVFWQAVKAKDARFDGAFVFGVKTTGIFCKPSCQARLPKRENVEFFDACEAAETCGFQGMFEVQAGGGGGADPQVAKVVEGHAKCLEEDAKSLDELAATRG